MRVYQFERIVFNKRKTDSIFDGLIKPAGRTDSV